MLQRDREALKLLDCVRHFCIQELRKRLREAFSTSVPLPAKESKRKGQRTVPVILWMQKFNSIQTLIRKSRKRASSVEAADEAAQEEAEEHIPKP